MLLHTAKLFSHVRCEEVFKSYNYSWLIIITDKKYCVFRRALSCTLVATCESSSSHLWQPHVSRTCTPGSSTHSTYGWVASGYTEQWTIRVHSSTTAAQGSNGQQCGHTGQCRVIVEGCMFRVRCWRTRGEVEWGCIQGFMSYCLTPRRGKPLKPQPMMNKCLDLVKATCHHLTALATAWRHQLTCLCHWFLNDIFASNSHTSRCL